MSKQTPFFKFDAMQWLGGAIQQCTLEEKGLFIDLCALYWKNFEPVKIDAKLKVRYRYLEGTLSNLIGTLSDLGFIEHSEAGITVSFLDELMDDRVKFIKKCSDAGKKSKVPQAIKKEERRKKSVERRDKTNTPVVPKGTRFVKPSIAEVAAYVAERVAAGNPKISAEAFFDWYESNGWKTGRNPVKDWKACVRTWEGRERSRPAQKIRDEDRQTSGIIQHDDPPEVDGIPF